MACRIKTDKPDKFLDSVNIHKETKETVVAVRACVSQEQSSTALRRPITLGQEPVDPFTSLVHRRCVVFLTPGEIREEGPGHQGH